MSDISVPCECGSRAQWVRSNRYFCPNCHSLLIGSFVICPHCAKAIMSPDQGVLGNWQWLEIWGGKEGKKKLFHPSCYGEYCQELVQREQEFERGIAFAEALAELSCPHCGEVGISQYPDHYAEDGTLIGVYVCNSCDTEIDTEWVEQQLEGMVPE